MEYEISTVINMEMMIHLCHVHTLGMLVILCTMYKVTVTFNVDTKSPLIFTGPPNSYFGYSVSILENSQGTWLLVGAPRANDSSLNDVHQPGAVFQCNWQYRSSCQPIFIDSIGNERQLIPKPWKNITVMHHKENQWLGASIDVNVHGDRQVMICAPRWIERKFRVQGKLFMNGLCYESNKELFFNSSSAWPALEYFKKQIHPNGFHSYGSGSLGMSSAYSQNGKFSVLGAPGLNDWSGGFAFIDGTKDVKPRVMEIPVELHNNSYYGLSITTAKLSAEDVFIIIGGPKSGPGGKIMAYNRKFQLLFVKEGEQLGSSFGWSVCAVDLNKDGLDDLVVGAPLHTDIMDEGRVYVYMNREFFNLELITPVLKGSNTKGARFGTAVSNVGDLNGDGCEDIAVGAPYEEGSGVVYIYNGDKKHGLHFKWSQRIVGKSINHGLKTFGWSFSRPWDVDSNHYKDFAVGAFESNKVVLLRTRSVLDLFASLEVTPSLLDMQGMTTCTYRGEPWHCLEAKICLRYKGLNLPPSAEVNITLKLDTLERHRGERSRLFSRDDKGQENESFNKLVTVRLGRLSCYPHYKVYVRPSRDILTPLKLELEYNIASDSIGIASLCTICPIRNVYNPSVVHDLVQFVNNCGNDNECHSDLAIEAHPVFNNKRGAFVIDDNPSFDMEITVSNNLESSYFTVVILEYPSYVFYASVRMAKGIMNDVICMQSTTSVQNNSSISSITCEIISPLETDEQAVFAVTFYAHGIPYEVHEFDLVAKASTASLEKTELTKDNSVTSTIPIYMESNVELSGVSIPGQVAVMSEAEDNLSSLPLSHFYILRNFGPSPIPHAQLTLSVPQFYGLDVQRVHVETVPVTESSHVPVECSLSEKLTSTKEDNMFLGRKKYDESGSFMTCKSTPCAHIRCYIGLMHKYEAVYLNISMRIRQDILESLDVSNQLGFVSSGWLEEPDYSSYYSLHITQNTTIGTLIVHSWHSHTSIQWWILVLSVICGLLLLYLITVILWKCGFFKRKKKEELMMLIKSTEAEREILNADSLSATSSDIMVLPPNDNSLMFTSPINNNNNDSIRSVGPFTEGHNVSTLYRRNYHYDDDSREYLMPLANEHSSYTHPRQIRHPYPEQDIMSRPRHMDTFNSMPRSESRYNSQCYLQPLSDYDYHHHQSNRNNRNNNINNTNDRLECLRIPPPPHSTVSSRQAFSNDMYLEPLESRPKQIKV